MAIQLEIINSINLHHYGGLSQTLFVCSWIRERTFTVCWAVVFPKMAYDVNILMFTGIKKKNMQTFVLDA